MHKVLPRWCLDEYFTVCQRWWSYLLWFVKYGTNSAFFIRRHQAITLTNVDISVKSNDIHIRAISQEMPQPSIIKIRLKITYLKFHPNFPRANELIALTRIKYARGIQPESCWFCKTRNRTRETWSGRIINFLINGSYRFITGLIFWHPFVLFCTTQECHFEMPFERTDYVNTLWK